MTYRYNVHKGVQRIKSRIELVLSSTLLGIGGLAIMILAPPGAKAAGPCAVPSGSYPTIQSAVLDPGCTTINVAPGVYNENVAINRALTLNGAQAGVDARTRSGPESIINGGAAANVT